MTRGKQNAGAKKTGPSDYEGAGGRLGWVRHKYDINLPLSPVLSDPGRGDGKV